MNLNADLIARYMLKMAVEIEALLIENAALAQENAKLKEEAKAQAGSDHAEPE